MNSDDVPLGSNVINLTPEESVLELDVGDTIRLSAQDLTRLAAAFFAELERKLLTT